MRGLRVVAHVTVQGNVGEVGAHQVSLRGGSRGSRGIRRGVGRRIPREWIQVDGMAWYRVRALQKLARASGVIIRKMFKYTPLGVTGLSRV